MLTMFFEMALYALGAALIIYLVYTLFLSSGSAQKPEAKKHRRFERREGERGDRRKVDKGPPEGMAERRRDSRRNRD
ncbi:hypothetical protein SAMN04488068_1842 [Hydrocarboniphaga daqingensis]|jgi:Flp pilus assembly protein TadB|uniref:Uncharacterized protein n=1 Tax=Hydrocarboniphaga daqingensis TaxID=490188 RepID=A0A1M5NSS5_9GAMM|nr:hypothetical protein [Hydrocarboniphaga daqingensis]SHG92495.1 hypothetical protein SAMN04488068_1842 [Hydrocarboniphaga daqingensis]